MISQTTAITGINLKSLPSRLGTSAVIVVALAGVVAVFTALLAMASGFAATLGATGRTDVAMILRGGSQAELNSGLDRESVTLMKQAAGILHDADDKPIAAAEMVVIAELLKRDSKAGSNITVRGVEPMSFALRPQVRIVEGRAFQPGLRELIVGRGVTRQFEGAGIGQTLQMRGSVWTVVGIFESGDASESELWADVEVAQSTFNRGGFSALRAKVADATAVTTLRDTLKNDPRFNVDVQTEQAYFSGQSKQFRGLITVLAGFITIVMGLGATFAALNAMYAAVSTRAREIATLRAIGFGGLPVVLSVMIESMVLALLGGLLGAAIAYLLFNNVALSTLGAGFTQVVFSFKVTPALVVIGMIIALAIGFFGGLLPAWRAARMPVTTALRAL